MKAIENKKVRITVPDAEGSTRTLDYADLIANVVNQVPQGGVNPSEMGKRLNILKALDKSDGDENNIILFEDADAAKLKELVKSAKWPNIHEDIITMTNDIIDIKSEETVRESINNSKVEKSESKFKPVENIENSNHPMSN